MERTEECLEASKSLLADSAACFNCEAGEVDEAPVAQLVELIGWKICRSLGLNRDDHAELCQELRMDLVRRARAYSPQRGPWLAFARLILNHQAAALYRRRLRRAQTHLGAPWFSGKSLQSEDDPALASSAYDLTEALDRDMDVDETVTLLPEPLPQFCQLLQLGHNLTEISRILQVPRSTVRGWQLQVRRRFEDRNLDQYL